MRLPLGRECPREPLLPEHNHVGAHDVSARTVALGLSLPAESIRGNVGWRDRVVPTTTPVDPSVQIVTRAVAVSGEATGTKVVGHQQEHILTNVRLTPHLVADTPYLVDGAQAEHLAQHPEIIQIAVRTTRSCSSSCSNLTC